MQSCLQSEMFLSNSIDMMKNLPLLLWVSLVWLLNFCLNLIYHTVKPILNTRKNTEKFLKGILDLWCLGKIEKTLNLFLATNTLTIAWSTIHKYTEKYWKVFGWNFGSLMSRQNWKDFELILGDEYIKNRMMYNSFKGPILN